MSATIEISPRDEVLWSILQGKVQEYPGVALLRTDTGIVVDLYKRSWNPWKELLMAYAEHSSQEMTFVFDRDGDEENEIMRIHWNGSSFLFI